MAFFVYLFVLLVAAGSVIFGLDLTQAPLQPPSYTTANAAKDALAVNAAAKAASVKAEPGKSAAPAGTLAAPAVAKAGSGPIDVAAAHAQATPDEAQTAPQPTTAAVNAPNHCAVDACAAAYHSFRASDCTYQPFGSERRLCTKGVSTKRIAAARTPVHHVGRSGDMRRAYDRRYAERDSYRDSYDEPRRGWAHDLFGDAFGR